jgi:hypothetical protein
MRLVIDARGEVKLFAGTQKHQLQRRAPSPSSLRWVGKGELRGAYESSILQALNNFRRQGADGLLIRVAGRGLVVQQDVFHGA